MPENGRATPVRKENTCVPIGPVQNTGQSLGTYNEGCPDTLVGHHPVGYGQSIHKAGAGGFEVKA